MCSYSAHTRPYFAFKSKTVDKMETTKTYLDCGMRLEALCRHLDSMGCDYSVSEAAGCRDTAMVSVENRHGKGSLDIIVGGRYTMRFDGWQAEYEAEDEGDILCSSMAMDLDALLANRLGIGKIRREADGLYGSRLVGDRDIEDDQVKVFWFLMDSRESRSELCRAGSRVEYSYWNPYKDFSFALDVDRLRAMDGRIGA